MEGLGYFTYGMTYYTGFADMLYRYTDGAIDLMEKGLDIFTALDMGITNKTFDTYEQTLIRDTIRTRISKKTVKKDLFVK